MDLLDFKVDQVSKACENLVEGISVLVEESELPDEILVNYLDIFISRVNECNRIAKEILKNRG